MLIDGHHRYAICQQHGIPFQTHQMEFESMGEAKKWAFEHQRDRRNLNSFALIELALQFEPIIAAIGKEKQRASGGDKKSQASGKPVPSIMTKPIDTRQELAKLTGLSTGTIAQAKIVSKKAPAEVKEKLRRNETTIGAVYQDIRRREKEQEREAQRQANRDNVAATLPLDQAFDEDTRFSTIVIDPPWDWGDEGDGDQLGRARPTYGTMSLAELFELPVSKWSDVNCHLFLWITNRSLPKGFQLLERWGFRYITQLTWCKPSFGMGNYFRGSTEQILFGVKGSLPLKRRDVGTWFPAPRGPRGHSSKPVEFYDLVESCCHGAYLELFARSQRPNWASWGAEANAA